MVKATFEEQACQTANRKLGSRKQITESKEKTTDNTDKYSVEPGTGTEP